MVRVVESPTSLTDNFGGNLGENSRASSSPRTTSSDELYRYDSDPDSLIRTYFRFSSQHQRANLRKTISERAKHLREVLRILDFSRKNDIYEAYDAGIDLLAEFENINFFTAAVNHLEYVSRILSKDQLKILDDFWEVLIKGLACAYKIPAEKRLDLLIKVLTTVLFMNRRQVKIAIIDSLANLSDEIEPGTIAEHIRHFTLPNELDEYVQAYAQDALQDFS